MSKISCHIIQDILPLYVDGIVSEDTKEMVEEHLRECESCRKEAEHMQERIVLPNKKEFYQKEQEMLQKFKRRLINRRVLSDNTGRRVCMRFAGKWVYNSDDPQRSNPV